MKDFKLSCPLPLTPRTTVSLGHGSGGILMRRLIRDIFLTAFPDPALHDEHDGAILEPCQDKLAFATDSFVIRPIFFPGGDIGSLAVHGTANDLAMCGAQPLYLSCGFIIEEGFSIKDLEKVAKSMARTAHDIGLRIVTGDTKVVERGKGDEVYINTAGVGRVIASQPILPSRVRPGDLILLSGDVGSHGAAILSVREGLQFETQLVSDAAHLWPQVRALLESGAEIHCLRDLTRGGLAAALNEIAEKAACSVAVEEDLISVRPEVKGACEMFGLDPLALACEGRFIAFVPKGHQKTALNALEAARCDATIIGEVREGPAGEVRLKTNLGVERILDAPSGEALPRIC